MAVFLYAPGVKVYIDTQDNGVLDISEDLVDGSLARRSDGVSTFNFDLQNSRRKYDGIFAPNDRIIVMMKRISWLRVFTGYLNQVPLITAWPQTVSMAASCSLKRIQYWYTDPGTAAFQNLVAQALDAMKGADDGGVSNAVLSIMNSVMGWPASKVHIAGIPQNWFKFAYKIAKNVAAEASEADQLAQQFYAQLGASGTVGGVIQGQAVASDALKAGTYAGYAIDKDQAAIAVGIYNVGVQAGATTRDIMVAIMTAMDESTLRNVGYGTSDSLGIFQQRPSQGWGTAAQVMNPTYAAQKFFGALMKITSRNSLQPYQEAQAVQRSADSSGSNYEKFQTFATQIVNVLAGGSGSSLGSSAGFQSLLSNWKTGTATGASLLATATALATAHPDIAYQEGGDSAPSSTDPTVLDCSSAQQWIRYNTLGSLKGMPRVAADQSSWCKSAGQIISAEQGMKIRGALMFMGPTGAATHVEMSLGDGKHTIGAHHSGTYFGVVESAGAWTNAGLQPDADFSADGGIAATSGVSGGVQLSQASSQPWYNPSDPFDKLFGNSPWAPVYDIDTVESEALTGVRALLNDQPLLPYLKNLLNSTMRSFSSAPNGDFIAWFPDYYGIWGTAAIMQIEPIELQDFTVYWSDDFFVTHQFTVAPPSTQGLDLLSGSLDSDFGPLITVTTDGIATIDIPGIMYALFGLEPTKAQSQQFISYIYKRFGARPDFQQLPGVVGPQGEFFSALFLFMRQWAYQYNADIPVTFMPELWPGMLAQIPALDFQAYVTTVTHNFSFGPDGGFSTTINIAAPARLSQGKNKGLIGLPVAGGLTG